ncbi:hypothetical protein [Vibrio cholerae]|uniref:hypothetical protein n=1 Tax=Vibrio cholerae TaxID=666 RepID=UPI001C31144E
MLDMKIKKNLLLKLSLTFLFCAFTVNNLVISVESYFFISYFRSFLIAGLLLSLFLCLMVFRLPISLIFSLVFFIFLSFLNLIFRIEDFDFVLLRDLFLIVVGSIVIFLLLDNYHEKFERSFSIFLILYFFIIILFILLSNSILLDFPPRFNFSYGSELINRTETYSLGVTNFFGLMSIALVNAYVKKFRYGFLFLISSYLALFLSMLGGARGEFVFAVLIHFLVLMFCNFDIRRFISLFIGLMLFLVIFISYVDFNSIIAEVELFKRLESLAGGDLSFRDVLIFEAVILLKNNPGCLLIGCGPSYFQYYYGYSEGLYPHNSLLEFIISYGVVFFTIFGIVSMLGVYKFFRKTGWASLILMIFFFLFLVSLKSGYLLGSWFLMSLLFAFSAFFMKHISTRF